ncbi:MAG: tRNA (adenosine(37)-N6)-threonylcarbamoyltransferase complex dimerization subunit type 1 TsaB [Pseudomonadota bacterium]
MSDSVGTRPLILGFDTTAAHCAAVLLSGTQVLASAREEMARGQAERLVPLIQDVLATADVNINDLDALGVGVGPGNFTGTRLAVATARGLSLACRIPAVGVSGLEALAFGAEAPVLASLDARSGQVYLQGFGRPPANPEIRPTDALGAPDFNGAGPSSDVLCVGDHAERIAAAHRAKVGAPLYPTAEAVARIASTRYLDTDTPRPAPIYLRPAGAAPAADPPPLMLT